MLKSKTYVSRSYWNNYIDSLIDSIQEDKDTILDILMYGNLDSAKITLNISVDKAPNYTIEITKFGEKSPFGDLDDDK